MAMAKQYGNPPTGIEPMVLTVGSMKAHVPCQPPGTGA
jgi:hypothetical protein